MRINITKDNRNIKYLYHYTLKENVDAILSSKQIKSSDDYMFFTDSYENAIELFEDEMMSDHLYYDLEGKLQRREPARKEDYRLIKIPYKNDGKFVIFNFDKEYPNSIYSRSRIHRGTLYFDKAEVLELGEYTKSNIFKAFDKLKLSLSLATFTLGLLPCFVKADSWFDNGNYDISWWDGNPLGKTNFDTEEQLAGYFYLLENDQIEYIQCRPTSTSNIYSDTNFSKTDIDLTAHDWKIKTPSACACICGVHRVLLRGGQTFPVRECNNSSHPGHDSKLTFAYKFKYSVEEVEHGTVTVDDEYLLTGEESTIRLTPDEGYCLAGYYINDKYNNYGCSTAQSTVKYLLKAPTGTSAYNQVIRGVFEEARYAVNYYGADGVKYSIVDADYVDNYNLVKYNSDFTFKLEVLDGFTIKKVLINEEPVNLNSDGTYTIKNIKDNVQIEVESESDIFKPSNKEDYVIKLWDKEQLIYGNYSINNFILNFGAENNLLERIEVNNAYKIYSQMGYLFRYSYDDDIIPNPSADITYNIYFDIDDTFRDRFADEFERELPSNYKRTVLLAKDDSEINNKVKIKSFKKKELAKEAVLVAPPTYNILRAFSNVEFVSVGDYITYEMVIENNTDEYYTFEELPESEYILYGIQIDNDEEKILPNTDTTAIITIKYDKEIDDDMYDEDVYSEDRIIPLYILDKDGNRVALSASKAEDPINPNTAARNIIIGVSIVVISGVACIILLKTKKQQWVAPFVIVALLTIPVLTNAEYNNNIELHSKVTIRRVTPDIIIGGRKMSLSNAYGNVCATSATVFAKSKSVTPILPPRSPVYEYGPDAIFPFVKVIDNNIIGIGYEDKNGVKGFTANITTSIDDVTDEISFVCSDVSIPDGLTVEVDGKVNDEEAICNLIVNSSRPCVVVDKEN